MNGFSQFLVAKTAEIIMAYRALLLRICVITFFGFFLGIITFQNFLILFHCLVIFGLNVCMYGCHYFYFIVLGSCIPKSINYLRGACM